MHHADAHFRTSLSHLLREGKFLACTQCTCPCYTFGHTWSILRLLRFARFTKLHVLCCRAWLFAHRCRCRPGGLGEAQHAVELHVGWQAERKHASTSEGRTGRAGACPAGSNRVFARVCASSLICYDTVVGGGKLDRRARRTTHSGEHGACCGGGCRERVSRVGTIGGGGPHTRTPHATGAPGSPAVPRTPWNSLDFGVFSFLHPR